MLNQRLQECLKTRSPITKIETLESDSMVLSTKLHGVKIFSTSDCSVTKNLAFELLGHKTTATAFSAEHKLLAFANAKSIYVVDLQDKLILQSIKTDDGEIEILEFAPNSSYLIAGTKEGRVSQYRYDGRAQLSRLCSFPYKREQLKHIKNNYVSAFAFHSHYLACSGYGGSITLIKMSSLSDKRVIEASKVRINALCFLDNEHLLSGSIDGILRVHYLKSKTKTLTINLPYINIKKILKMPNSRYVMICCASNKLTIVDIVSAKVVSKEYLSLEEEIRDIALDAKEQLYIALENNTLYKFELPNSDELKVHIASNRLDEAFKLLESDPMLQNTREHKRVEVLYEKLYSQAIEALVHHQTQEANRLMEMFRDVASKREEVRAIFKDFEYYSRFKLLVSEQKYALAYAMSEKFLSLKKTLHFKKMEESFKDAFGFAQKQILMQREDIALEVLAPYRIVLSKKAIITLLLKQNRDFIDFLRAIQSKNYLLIKKLLGKNELFSQIPTYIALKASEEEKLDTITQLIYQSKTKEAHAEIEAIAQTTTDKERLKELQKLANLVEKLQANYAKKDLISCYETLDTNYALSELELSEFLENEWSKLMQECEEYALKGDIKSIKERLGVLIAVPTRLAKVGDLLRVSFHSKIKGLLAKKSYLNAENIIYSYVDIFGVDSEILALMHIHEKITQKKLAFTLNQEREVPRDNWIHSALIMTPSNLK